MTNIATLAEREARAEASKGKADAAWRKAWWATTIALGEAEGKIEVGAAQKIVREATGQSVNYVQRRTRTGRGFACLGACDTLPPKMAIEVVAAGVEVTEKVAKQMLKAEKDGVSLREFTSTLTGKGWADTPEGASTETITRIVQAQPERVAAVVAQQPQAREHVVQQVTSTQTGRREVEHHAEQARRREVPDAEALDRTPTPLPADDHAEANRIIGRLDGIVMDIERLAERGESRAGWEHLRGLMPARIARLEDLMRVDFDVPDDISSLGR